MSPPSTPEEEAPSSPEEQEHRSSRPMSPAAATPEGHMNKDHADDTKLIVQHSTSVKVDFASILDVDSLGINVKPIESSFRLIMYPLDIHWMESPVLLRLNLSFYQLKLTQTDSLAWCYFKLTQTDSLAWCYFMRHLVVIKYLAFSAKFACTSILFFCTFCGIVPYLCFRLP